MPKADDPSREKGGSILFAAVRGLSSGLDALSDIGARASGVMMGVTSLLIVSDVIGRYVLNRSTLWGYEVVIYLMIWFVFLAQAFTLKEGGHIHVDLLVSRLAPAAQQVLGLATYLLSLVFCALFSYYSFKAFMLSFTMDRKTGYFLQVPEWAIMIALFVGMVLLSFQVLRKLVGTFHAVRREASKGSSRLRDNVAAISIFLTFVAVAVALTQLNPAASLILLLLTLLLGGVPVAFALGITGTAGLFFFAGGERMLAAVPFTAYALLNSFVLVALPLFIFTAYLMKMSGMADSIFGFLTSLVGHVPGGLAVVTIGACAFVATISGSSAATAATVAIIAIPTLLSRGYSSKMACGVVASGGTLGILIPPSISMILYGVFAEQSIGKLFMAGLLPGIVLAAMLGLTAFLMCKRSSQCEPLPRASWKESLSQLKRCLGGLMVPVIIIGGIYTGTFTPTEAAGIAVVLVLLLVITSRTIKLKDLGRELGQETKTMAMVLMIIFGALILGTVVTLLEIPQNLAEALIVADITKWQFIVVVMALLLVLGMFLEGTSIIVLTVPIFAPVAALLGIDLIWFGVLYTINLELAQITPPVGINLYVVQQISKRPLLDVIWGTAPFAGVILLSLVLVALVPQLSLWLPGTM